LRSGNVEGTQLQLLKVDQMAQSKGKGSGRQQNTEVTSARAASAASKVLQKPTSGKAPKTAAASALTQRPDRKK
jgi:hypothetical protein